MAGSGASSIMAKSLKPMRGDISVLKPRHSAFYGTPLDILLEGMGAREIILAGIATDMCVHLTAADAFLRSYKVRVPANWTASETVEAKHRSLEHMDSVLRCDVRPMEAGAMLRLC